MGGNLFGGIPHGRHICEDIGVCVATAVVTGSVKRFQGGYLFALQHHL